MGKKYRKAVEILVLDASNRLYEVYFGFKNRNPMTIEELCADVSKFILNDWKTHPSFKKTHINPGVIRIIFNRCHDQEKKPLFRKISPLELIICCEGIQVYAHLKYPEMHAI